MTRRGRRASRAVAGEHALLVFTPGSSRSSDADRPAALRSGDREAPELRPEHGGPRHRLDLRRRSDHAGKLPGTSMKSVFFPKRAFRWRLILFLLRLAW